ncbi:hypothetical protein C0J52_18655 [Blattella germanica]|nr:hypothetical protein C0J52_18655 [Blattella germanica]
MTSQTWDQTPTSKVEKYLSLLSRSPLHDLTTNNATHQGSFFFVLPSAYEMEVRRAPSTSKIPSDTLAPSQIRAEPEKPVFDNENCSFATCSHFDGRHKDIRKNGKETMFERKIYEGNKNRHRFGSNRRLLILIWVHVNWETKVKEKKTKTRRTEVLCSFYFTRVEKGYISSARDITIAIMPPNNATEDLTDEDSGEENDVHFVVPDVLRDERSRFEELPINDYWTYNILCKYERRPGNLLSKNGDDDDEDGDDEDGDDDGDDDYEYMERSRKIMIRQPLPKVDKMGGCLPTIDNIDNKTFHLAPPWRGAFEARVQLRRGK